jgi:hypothetical protein
MNHIIQLSNWASRRKGVLVNRLDVNKDTVANACVTMAGCGSGKTRVSIRSEIAFCAILHLLGFDLWGNNGVVHHVRPVHSINWGHPASRKNQPLSHFWESEG